MHTSYIIITLCVCVCMLHQQNAPCLTQETEILKPVLEAEWACQRGAQLTHKNKTFSVCIFVFLYFYYECN